MLYICPDGVWTICADGICTMFTTSANCPSCWDSARSVFCCFIILYNGEISYLLPKVRLSERKTKFWSSECREKLAFALLSRDKISRRQIYLSFSEREYLRREASESSHKHLLALSAHCHDVDTLARSLQPFPGQVVVHGLRPTLVAGHWPYVRRVKSLDVEKVLPNLRRLVGR